MVSRPIASGYGDEAKREAILRTLAAASSEAVDDYPYGAIDAIANGLVQPATIGRMSALRPTDIIDPGFVLFDLAAGAAQPGGWLDAEPLLDMKKRIDGGGLGIKDPALSCPYLAKGLMGEQPSRMLVALRAQPRSGCVVVTAARTNA